MVTSFDIETSVAGRPTDRRAGPNHRDRLFQNDGHSGYGKAGSSMRRDQLDSTPVVIVNERFAQKFFPRPEPQSVNASSPDLPPNQARRKMREIVGVVGNVKHLSLKNDDSPEMYLPRTQIPFDIMSLVVRTSVLRIRRPSPPLSERNWPRWTPRFPSPVFTSSTNTFRALWRGRASTLFYFPFSPARRLF